MNVTIAPLGAKAPVIAALADILIETVAHGGSVSFMHPVEPDVARDFWTECLDAAARGERVVLGAWDGDLLVATVTVILCPYPNQQHRAEIAKMMTRVSHRRRGIAHALMIAAEREALAHGRTLLVLDTAVIEGAGPLYESLGFQKAGVIPDFALKPHGGLTGTIYYWKRIGETP